MVTRLATDILLLPHEIKPSHKNLEVLGVFNPGAIRFDDSIILLVRVAERVPVMKKNWRCIPTCVNGKFSFTWQKIDPTFPDYRKFKLYSGHLVPSSISHFKLVRLNIAGTAIHDIETMPDLFPQDHDEVLGIEDPRITEINGTFYITYVALSPAGTVTKLMTTKDFSRFQRHGVIFPTENKDVVLFPQKINGQYFALHRPVSSVAFGNPSIWSATSPNLTHWGQYQVLAETSRTFDRDRIGSGAPPIKTKDGWLMIYHGVDKSKNKPVGIYAVGAMLLENHNPTKIKYRSLLPLIKPELPHEMSGVVPHVLFPTGVIAHDDTITIYCGAADTYTIAVTLSLPDILKSLKSQK